MHPGHVLEARTRAGGVGEAVRLVLDEWSVDNLKLAVLGSSANISVLTTYIFALTVWTPFGTPIGFQVTW